MCLADRFETLQGDTRRTSKPSQRSRVVSYGNRLLCDSARKGLRHKWGSGSLYRAYYQDYQSFLSRAEVVGDGVLKEDNSRRVMIVTSDLRQFFDRVRPRLLMDKLQKRSIAPDDAAFYHLARRVLNWGWSADDKEVLADYKANTELSEFDTVAL